MILPRFLRNTHSVLGSFGPAFGSAPSQVGMSSLLSVIYPVAAMSKVQNRVQTGMRIEMTELSVREGRTAVRARGGIVTGGTVCCLQLFHL